jgi:peptide deformylase|tara:strand:- start:27 stop:521 length:495 start_codon:yes stop_codon:yes gene_type:complete
LSVREIRLFGDPILVTPSLEILDFASAAGLIQDLIDTASLSGRAGVAATQIGVGLSAFAYNIEGEIGYLINPKITELSGELIPMEEGCLSVPGLWHPAKRHTFARASGFLLDGTAIEISGEGLMAQALQHEIDHLAGILYLDRLEKQERKLAFKTLRDQAWFTR